MHPEKRHPPAVLRGQESREARKCFESVRFSGAPGFYCQDAVLQAKVPLPVFPGRDKRSRLAQKKGPSGNVGSAACKERLRLFGKESIAFCRKKRTVPVQHTEGSVAERLVAPFSSRWDTVFGALPGEADKAERRRRRSSGAERIPIAFTRRRRMNTTRKWRLWRISAHAQTSPCRRYGHRRRGSISAHAQTGQISRQHQMTRPMTRTLSARSPCKSTLMGEYSGLRLRSTSFPPGRVSTCLM